jgi:hypothetical protein
MFLASASRLSEGRNPRFATGVLVHQARPQPRAGPRDAEAIRTERVVRRGSLAMRAPRSRRSYGAARFISGSSGLECAQDLTTPRRDCTTLAVKNDSSIRPRARRATKQGKVQLLVYVSPERRRALKQAAARLDRTASSIVDEALTKWLAENLDDSILSK